MPDPSFRVVLVGPENPLNIGFVARAMRCFGVEELVIAASAWTEMPDGARKTGVSAPEVLDRARFTATLEEALAGCDTAAAFSRRPSTLRQRKLDLPGGEAALRGAGLTALVFGRESNGLTRQESALCPFAVRIPCREGLSLNLGQAAAVALASLTAPEAGGRAAAARPAAGVDRLLGLWKFLDPRLSAAPRFTVNRRQRIRQMLYRLTLDDEDFDLLFAVMTELAVPAAARRARRQKE